MNKMKLITILIFTFSAFWTHAQDTLALNLEKCREMAVENSKKMQIADATIEKANGEKTAARSAWFPNISASATGIYSKQEIRQEMYLPTQVLDPATGQLVPNVAVNPATGQPITGPDGNPVFNMYAYLPLDITLNGGMIAGVSAEQPLYAGGKIMSGNKMAGIGMDMANTNKQLQKAEVIYEAEQAYYTYLSVKEKVKLAKKYQSLLKQLVTTMEDSYNAGMTNRNDLLKVQVQYNEASLQLQKAESGLTLSKMSLCRVIGVNLYTAIAVNDSINTNAPDINNITNPNVSNKLEYQLLEQKTNIAKENIKMVRGDYLPTAGISLGYNYFNIAFQDADNYDSDGFSAIASIKIPITKFGEGYGKIKAAKEEYRISQLELEQTTEWLLLEMEQAKLSLIDAYTRIEMTAGALEQADENLRVSKDNYELGMEPVINLLEAQAGWQKAYSNYIDAQTDYKIKECNYLRVNNYIR